MSTEVPSPRQAQQEVKEIREAINRSIIGQEEMVNGLLAGLLVSGHVLIEGVPGLGKTRAVHALARACSADFKRLQFTPDLLPADIVGTQIYNQQRGDFETRTGPVFTNILLADEINRAAPKVQSALLEAMQERQVTLGAESHRLPRPFVVFATQNPIEQEGTYPLPEAQVDRFLLKLVVGYPDQDEEKDIVRLVMNETELPKATATVSVEQIIGLQDAVRGVFVEDRILDYATDLVFSTRQPAERGLAFEEMIELGASPRASINLVQVGRAHALMDGRDAVLPEDVKAIAANVLRHRVLMTYHAEAEGMTAETVIQEILRTTKVP